MEHKAGVRPAVRDRRPLVGVHPKHPRLFVLNGLGTKGTMIAPYCAMKLIGLTEQGIKPEQEINIERFRHIYEESLSGAR